MGYTLFVYYYFLLKMLVYLWILVIFVPYLYQNINGDKVELISTCDYL